MLISTVYSEQWRGGSACPLGQVVSCPTLYPLSIERWSLRVPQVPEPGPMLNTFTLRWCESDVKTAGSSFTSNEPLQFKQSSLCLNWKRLQVTVYRRRRGGKEKHRPEITTEYWPFLDFVRGPFLVFRLPHSLLFTLTKCHMQIKVKSIQNFLNRRFDILTISMICLSLVVTPAHFRTSVIKPFKAVLFLHVIQRQMMIAWWFYNNNIRI